MSPLPEWIELQQRKPNRAPGHDYRQGGYYHIVFCTELRRPLLGRQVGAEVELTDVGRMVAEEIGWLGMRFEGLTVDSCRVMDNHVHLLLLNDGLSQNKPDVTRVVGSLKSRAATRYLKWRELRQFFTYQPCSGSAASGILTSNTMTNFMRCGSTS